MNLENIEISKDYEGLKRQFLALKNILQCKQVELKVYHKRMEEFDFNKVIKLEAEIESQKEMNSILTKEINELQ